MRPSMASDLHMQSPRLWPSKIIHQKCSFIDSWDLLAFFPLYLLVCLRSIHKLYMELFHSFQLLGRHALDKYTTFYLTISYRSHLGSSTILLLQTVLICTFLCISFRAQGICSLSLSLKYIFIRAISEL